MSPASSRRELLCQCAYRSNWENLSLLERVWAMVRFKVALKGCWVEDRYQADDGTYRCRVHDDRECELLPGEFIK